MAGAKSLQYFLAKEETMTLVLKTEKNTQAIRRLNSGQRQYHMQWKQQMLASHGILGKIP